MPPAQPSNAKIVTACYYAFLLPCYMVTSCLLIHLAFLKHMLTLRKAKIILMATQRIVELQELHLVMNQKHNRHMFFFKLPYGEV